MLATSRFKDFKTYSQSFQPTPGTSFTLFHVNVRSLHKHWDEFRLVINSVLPIADAFVLMEVNIRSEDIEMFSLPGFNSCFRTRENKRGGGIAVFLKTSLLYSEITVSFLTCESVALHILTSMYDLYLLVFYRPPSESVANFLTELRNCLQSLPVNATLCLTGDINIDLMKPSKSLVCEYLTLLSDYGVEPTILNPTREEFLGGKLVSSSIDHINLRAPTSTTQSAIITEKLSDHYFVACHLEFPGKAPINSRIDIRRVDIIDPNTFDGFISNYNWGAFQAFVNPTEIYNSFVDIFTRFSDASKKLST
ncbi:unnamed protein product [Ixodes persulcatus]